jgi:hypothetical protein
MKFCVKINYIHFYKFYMVSVVNMSAVRSMATTVHNFEVITDKFNVKKIAVFWVVAPCSLVEIYQRFRGPCCLHHQGDE